MFGDKRVSAIWACLGGAAAVQSQDSRPARLAGTCCLTLPRRLTRSDPDDVTRRTRHDMQAAFRRAWLRSLRLSWSAGTFSSFLLPVFVRPPGSADVHPSEDAPTCTLMFQRNVKLPEALEHQRRRLKQHLSPIKQKNPNKPSVPKPTFSRSLWTM